MRVPALRLDENGNIIAKDGQGNDIQITDSGSLNSGNGALGGYLEQLIYAVTASTTSSTFVDIAGMTNQSFTTPVSGPHLIQVAAATYAATTWAQVEVGLVIDDTTAQSVGTISNGDTSVFHQRTLSIIVDLEAGTHTIRPQWKRIESGTGTLNVHVTVPWKIDIIAQGSGINGLEVIEDTLASDWTQSTENVWEDTPLEVTFNTLEGERVDVSATGTIWADQTDELGWQSRFVVDGVTYSPYQYTFLDYNDQPPRSALVMSWVTPPLSAGEHTIKIESKISAGTADARWSTGSMLQVRRYKSFGIGAGTIIISDTFSANKNISSTSYEDTGLEVTFNTIEGEDVLLTFQGSCVPNAGSGSRTLRLAYQVDGGSDIPTIYSTMDSTGKGRNISFSSPIEGLSAGVHTVKLRAKRDVDDIYIVGSVGGDITPILSIIQHRGGLIPVRDSEGSEIVEKPSALEFGDGAVVSAQGTVARVDFPNAALGGYQEALIEHYPSIDTEDDSSLTYLLPTGISQVTMNTPVTGIHLFELTTGGYPTTGTVLAYYRIVIDKGTANEVILADSDVWRMYAATATQHDRATFRTTANIAAGEHTIDLEVKVNGNALRHNPNIQTFLSVQALGSGINGVETVEGTISANKSITSANPTFQDTGHEVIINTLEGEKVLLNFNGEVNNSNPSVRGNFYYAYSIDSGTDQRINVETVPGGETIGVHFSYMLPALSAGQHTIKLRAAYDSVTSGQLILRGTATGVDVSSLQATRFKSFGIGAGTIVTKDTATSDITVAHGTTFTDTELSFTINTIEDEEVLLLGNMVVRPTAGNIVAFVGRFSIDGTTFSPIQYLFEVFTSSTQRDTIDTSWVTPPLSAGEHTITYQAHDQGIADGTYIAGNNWSAGYIPTIQAIQFRGGLIPVQDDGVEIVDKPSALDFAGAGVTVTQSGTKALITIPGGGTPGAHASTHVDGGTDELDGDTLDVDFTPANYTPDATPAEANDVDDLAAHLKGIDTAIGAAGSASDFTDLGDTPASYTGEAGKIPRVNDAEDGLEFVMQPNAALGGYQELILEDTPSSNQDNSNTSYGAMTGISQQTFTTPVSGSHTFMLETSGAYVSTTVAAYFRIVIDKGTANEVIIGDSDRWFGYSSTAASFMFFTFVDVANLTAGEHTADFEMRVGSATWRRNATLNRTRCLVQAQGSGINGLEVLEDILTSNFTVTQDYINQAGGNMAQVSDVQCVVNTLENERVEVKYLGSALMDGGDTLVFGYQVDSDTPVPIHYVQDIDTTGTQTITFGAFTAPLSAGQHTIKLMACKISGTGPVVIYGTGTTNAIACKMQVIRYKTLNVSAAENYVDRGDPAAYDFATGDLTKDGTWHDLDLSSIVPPEAAGKEVQIRASIKKSTAGGASLNFREKGNTNSVNMMSISSTTDSTHVGGGWVKLDSNRVIQYMASNIGTWTAMNIVVRGWMVPGGGLQIPVQEDGTNKVNAPTALNFIGAGLTVTNNSEVADIDTGITEWTSWTPTGSWSTNTTYSGYYRIVGDTMEVTCKVLLGGAPDASNLTINLPSGWAIDTNKIVADSVFTPLGDCLLRDVDSGASYVGMVVYSSTSAVRALIQQASSTYTSLGSVNNTIPFTFANTDFIHLKYRFPVIAT